jgi:nucleoside-diphosphate-sugar epimerase
LSPCVAVTGATGLLGGHITDSLLGLGFQVRAAVRSGSDTRRLLDQGVDLITTNLIDPAAVSDFIAPAATVIHCAGIIRADSDAGYADANIRAVRTLVDAVNQRPQVETFILVSSLAASGPNTPDSPLQPRRESDECRPITAYGRSKLKGEEQLQDLRHCRSLILRPPALYGPRDRAFLPLFKAARIGLSMRVGNIRSLSLVDVRDCAAAVTGLLQNAAASGIFFVDDGHAYTFDDMARALGQACGRRVRPVPLPMWLLNGVARIVGRKRAEGLPLLAGDRLLDNAAAGWVCDGSRLRYAVPSLRFRDIYTGFAETLASYRDAGRL